MPVESVRNDEIDNLLNDDEVEEDDNV